MEKYAEDAVLALFGVPVADKVRRRHGVSIAIRIEVSIGEVVIWSWDASG